MGFRRWLAAFTALLLSAPAIATADEPAPPPHTALRWNRTHAPECIAQEDLVASVEAQLGYPAFVSAETATMILDAEVKRRPLGGHQATLVVRDGSGAAIGKRRLESTAAGCDGLRDQIVLAIALIIDPNAPLAPRFVAPATKPPEPEPERPPEPPPPPPRAEEGVHLAADLHGTAAAGLLPHIAAGGGFAVRLSNARGWSLRAGASTFIGQTETIRPSAGADPTKTPVAELVIHRADLALCAPIVHGPRVRPSVCGGVIGGLYRTEATDLAFAKSDHALLAGATAAVSLDIVLGRSVFVTTSFDAIVPFAKKDFVYAGADGKTHTVFEPGAVMAAARLGLGVYFF